MSLPPVIIRDIGDEVPASDRIIYAAFVRHLETPTTAVRAVKRAADDCGVSRARVLQVIRQHNADAMPYMLRPSSWRA